MDFRFNAPEEVTRNRTNFLQTLGINYEDHIAMRCTHEDTIMVVDRTHQGIGARTQGDQPVADVLITQEKSLALLLLTADCQAVSFYDPNTNTIALAHISRATLILQLPQKTVHFLEDQFGADPKNLLVHIGPSIRKESYRFPLPLENESPLLLPFTTKEDRVASIDLIEANLHQLTATGVMRENISIAPEDTARTEKYFSHYRAVHTNTPDEARMATVLMVR